MGSSFVFLCVCVRVFHLRGLFGPPKPYRCCDSGTRILYVFMIDFCILFQVIRGHYTPLNEVILEDVDLPGLTELRGSWHGSLDASGGGNGDTMVRILSLL